MLQVVFEGAYPLDGAKVVETAMTRTVGRLTRHARAMPGCKARHGCIVKLTLNGQDGLKALVANNTSPSLWKQQKQPQQKQAPGPELLQHTQRQLHGDEL